jgi:hypothetical protein
MVCDWLRSCYETNMVMQSDGTTYPVTWFFVPPSTPLFPGVHPASLNWIDDDGEVGQVGEEPSLGRNYYKGALPSWVGPNTTFATHGVPQSFITGAAGPSAGTNQDWLGRWFPNFDRLHLPVHPVPASTATAPQVTMPAGSTHPGTWPLTWSSLFNSWRIDFGDFSLNWAPMRCQTNVGVNGLVYAINRGIGWGTEFLRFLGYDASTKTSTYDDPDGHVFPAGQVASIQSF